MNESIKRASELEAIDVLAHDVGEIALKPELEIGQIVSRTEDMVTLPVLPEGLGWQCVRNASKGRLARWQVIEVE